MCFEATCDWFYAASRFFMYVCMWLQINDYDVREVISEHDAVVGI